MAQTVNHASSTSRRLDRQSAGQSPENDRRRSAPIAIVGMACRLPGAQNIHEYWDLIERGGDAIRRIPADRWDADEFYDPRPGTPGKTVLREGGFLDEIDKFDPYFFGISPREAVSQDPQQRLLLESVWHAIEDAGLRAEELVDSNTGVFVGYSMDDYSDLTASRPMSVGTAGSGGPPVASGRISTAFGFTGPSLTVDTACSSSLVATHLACKALENGECDVAFAGGVNVILRPQPSIGLSQGGMVSPDARCKAFDASADGYVRSEGVAVLALKRLDRALEDGDRIQAVIRGSAISNDGSNSPLLTPSQTGQVQAATEAYERSGVSPADVDYVEAHGTGTKVGDPIEVAALSEILSANRPADRPCKIGSVKTNIGHTEAAAGIAGIIKVVLAIRHRTIPASLHCKELNPSIPWAEVCVEVQRQKAPWPERGRPALAGVNSFGISGTNVHVVIEAPPAPPSSRLQESRGDEPHLLTLSGRTVEDLRALAGVYRDFLRSESGRRWTLPEICWTAGNHRSSLESRLAVPGASHAEIADTLDHFVEGDEAPGLSVGFVPQADESGPVFVFSGAGSQWPQMARELREQEEVFNAAMVRVDALVQKEVGWSVLEEIDKPAEESRIDEFDRLQVAIFAVQTALAALWRSWGVEPSAIVGHSLGEFAAAYVAGAISLEDAVRALCVRGRLLERLKGKGAMLAVALDEEQARLLIAGKEDLVAVAVLNSPVSTVLSGDPAVLEGILKELEARDIFCRKVKVDIASHSPQIEAIREEMQAELGHVEAHEAAIPLYSSVTGKRMTGAEYGAEYWFRSMRAPVLFANAIGALLDAGHSRFVELSGHPVLTIAIRQTAERRQVAVLAAGSLRRGEGDRAAPLGSLGALYAAGASIAWRRLYPEGERQAELPLFPWRRERYWLEGASVSKADRFLGHPMLQRHWISASRPGVHFWEADLRPALQPFFSEHRYNGLPLLPTTAYLEMALAASFRLHGPGPRIFKNVQLRRGLAIPADESRTIQLTLSDDKPGVSADFRLDSWQPSGDDGEWIAHCSGVLHYTDLELEDEFRDQERADALTERLGEPIDGERFYEGMNRTDIHYGDSFQGVQRMWVQPVGSESVHEARAASVVGDSKRFHIHPGFLDSIFQGYFSALHATTGASRTGLPVRLTEIQIRSLPDPAETYRVYSLVPPGLDGRSSDVYDPAGRLIIREIDRQMTLPTSPENLVDFWLYKVAWEEAPVSGLERADPITWVLLGAGGETGQAIREALQQSGARWIDQPDLGSMDRAEAAALLDSTCQLIDGQVGLIYLEGLDAPLNDELDPATLEASQERICGRALLLTQAMAARTWAQQPRLCVATRGAQQLGGESAPIRLAMSCLIGLTRVIASEHPAWRPLLTDLDPDAPAGDASLLLELLGGTHQEKEIAIRSGRVYGARLARLEDHGESHDHRRKISIGDDQPNSFKLETIGAGIVDNLQLRKTERRQPSEGEIEVRIAAVGLNFIDVLRCFGIQPGQDNSRIPFGMEAAGRVVAVGPGVSDLRVGDEVVVLGGVQDGAARAHMTIPRQAVFQKPPHLTLEEAAAIFVVYQTAHYSLIDKARLRKGEIILIHSAAGGVGLAALEMARWLGARVFATAGTPEKRELLRSMGAELVMDSHALDFEEEIQRYTEGRGVDVVLNSLAGRAIAKSLACLAIGGRFVEIGKRDIYDDTQIGLWPFQKNLSYFAVDLLRLSYERPDDVRELNANVIEKIVSGAYGALPVTSFPISEAGDAFRLIAKGGHIGKVVLTVQEESFTVADPSNQECTIRADGTYLIVGGLGGLGLLFAQWIIRKGGRSVALVGRRGETPESAGVLEELRQSGADVRVVAADVSKADDVDRLVAEIREAMPPLRGVIHSGASLDDGVLQQLDWSRFPPVLAPKVAGSWLLHDRLQDEELDFFAFFSSAAATMGAAGQGNYAAGNAFQDSLTQYRRHLGMPAMGVNWGPWAEIGLAAAQANRGDRIAADGIEGIPPNLGTLAFDRLLAAGVDQAVVIPINWKVWVERHPGIALDPMYWNLAASYADPDNAALQSKALLQDLANATPEEAANRIVALVAKQVSLVLKVPESRLDPKLGLGRFGLDSLMAVELKNRIEMTLPVSIPVARLIDGPSLQELTALILRDLAASKISPALPQPAAKADEPLTSAQKLLQSDVDELLAEMLTDDRAKVGSDAV